MNNNRTRPRIHCTIDRELSEALDGLAALRRTPRSRMVDRGLRLLVDQETAELKKDMGISNE